MKRSLRFWPLVATIYFCVSGGPFGLEEVGQSGVGMSLLLILAMPIVWAVPAALMTAELASAIPAEGGYYVWVKRALGPFWGFICGWWTWVYSWVDVAIYPVLFATYVQLLLRSAGVTLADEPFVKWGIGMAMVVPLTVLNIRGARSVGNSSLAFFGLLAMPFLVMVIIGLAMVWHDPYHAVHPLVAEGKTRSEAFLAGLFVVMWNYLGWDSMSTVAEEVEDPPRAYPRALATAVPLVVVSYLLPMLVGGVVLRDRSRWEEGAWTEVARLAGGPVLSTATTLAGIIAASGLFSSTLLAGSRIPFVLAEDDRIPHRLTELHPKYGTPWRAILVSSVFYSIFSFGSFKNLAEADVVVYSAALLLEFVALLVLRAREPDLPRPYRIPGGWPVVFIVALLPTVVLVAAIWNQLHSKEQSLTIAFTLTALATGPAVWLWQGRRRRMSHQ